MSESKTMERILITGAAGRIGRVLREGLASPHRILRLVDKSALGDVAEREEHYQIDAVDLHAMTGAMKGVDSVIHLAAYPEEAPWDVIFPLNYQLTHTLFEAARIEKIKRVIFASSVQAVGFHPLETTITDEARLRPSGFYGVSKAFGESLASLYADKFGLSVACVRIASFEEKPTDQRMLSTWLSHQDALHLFEQCLTAPEFHFFRVYGVSNNTRSRVDNSHVDWLGYRPQSDAEIYLEEIMAGGDPLGPLGGRTQGGGACDVDFAGDIEKAMHAR
ncbi:NAD(P)-dependent oxidoreductase [Kiloniella laminariae]|uniref:NAD(P)-dependent oxidoreductase n=1 Tax=Kiloniella laminariae TaxID=454162 RepID=A0ABT4LDM5_9PROT|nr:NAD(P)-dependent oxidoreductase [Kiloniella laminariae]MCZ4279202.1 NAD(P)-dependent oxidoreductase [Kiloniella laminariae]